MENNLQKRFETTNVGTSKMVSEILPIIGANGDYIKVTGKDAIITQVKNLLMTPLGFYPFDPQYGTLLYKQLFEPIDEDTEKTIYYEVKDRILMYVDGVEVDSVDLKWDEQRKSCTVNVFLNIKDEINKTKLSVEVKNSAQSMYDALDDTLYSDYRF